MIDSSTPTAEQNSTNFKRSMLARERRILTALVMGPITREMADRIGRVSNSPHYIGCLRHRGLTIDCLRRTIVNEDGTQCRPGVYRLAKDSLPLARDLLELTDHGA